MTDRLRSRIYSSIVWVIGLVLAIDLGAHLVADSLWFQELGYWDTFVARVTTQFSVWAIAFGSTLTFCASNFLLARQQRYAPNEWPREKREALEARQLPSSKFTEAGDRIPATPPLGLRWILILGIGLGCLIGSILLHYGGVMASLWHPDLTQLDISAPLPPRLNFETLLNWAIALPQNPWHIAVLVAVPSAFLYSTRVGASAGRRSSVVFDVNSYRAKNPDLAALSNDRLFSQFQAAGANTRRSASDVFDVNYYLNNNPDLSVTLEFTPRQAYKHYLINGINTNRPAFPPS